MSENPWDDDNFGESSEGPKALREAYEKLKKESAAKDAQLAERDAKISDLSSSLSAKTLTELTANLPANVVKYLKKDLTGEVTQEAVDKWLDENAADFGYDRKTETPAEQKQEQPVETAQPNLLTNDVFDEGFEVDLRATQALDTGKGEGNVASQVVPELLSRLGDNDALGLADVAAELRKAGINVTGI